MKAKSIVTVSLLVFVLASLAVMVVKEVGREEQPIADSSDPVAAEASPAVIVYYFHGNQRCDTCRTIEAFGEEAVTTAFATAIENGDLEWRTVNVDKPEHEHFLTDFELSSKTIVVAGASGSAEAQWVKLDRVWQLFDDKPAFTAYVQEGISGFMESHG